MVTMIKAVCFKVFVFFVGVLFADNFKTKIIKKATKRFGG